MSRDLGTFFAELKISQSHIKQMYLNIGTRSSAILCAHLLGKIICFCCFARFGSPCKRDSGKTAKTNIFPNKCARNIAEELG